MATERLIGCASRGIVVCLLVILVTCPLAQAQSANSSGTTVLVDFEEEAAFTHARSTNYSTLEQSSDIVHGGVRAAKIVYAAVPEGVRDFPAVVFPSDSLKLTDFTPFEALSLWVMNAGAEDVDLSLSIWDKKGYRSFPIPSTVTVKAGQWRQVVVHLALHGVDSKQIASVHFYQKSNRRPATLIIDDIQLLSPYAGRLVAKIQLARDNLIRARANSSALGAEQQIAPKIDALARRLDELEKPSAGTAQPVQKTQYLLALAQVTADSQSLVNSIVTRNEGKDIRLIGPQVEVTWLSNRERVANITSLRLFDTPLTDEVFSYLAPANQLQQLVIGSRNITGAGLDKLSTSSLTRLSMRATGANDAVLASVVKFPQLQTLELQETSVTSGLFQHLQNLAQLKVLALSDTAVSDAGFSAIAKLTSLESLELDRTKITGESLKHLENLEQLRLLNLDSTAVDDSGISFLGKLHKLESLILGKTSITGASFGKLESLDNLVTLNLNNTRVGDSAFKQLGALPKLKRLELSSTRITDGTVQQATQSAQLTYLDLYGTNLSDAGLAYLQNQRGLQDLYLGGTRASDTGIGHLKELKRLRQLDLGGTQISDAGLAFLKELINLDSLRLGNTRIGGPGLVHLAGLSKLRNLDLSGTGVSDQAIESLANLQNLRTLHLSGTQVTSKGMKSLQAAKQLVELHLDATNVGDEGLELLTALPNLQLLNLSETAVTNNGLRHLKQMEKLLDVRLNHTPISDEGLSQLGDHYLVLELTHTRITDHGIEYLRRNDQLRQLRLASTGITNDGLKLLQAMPNLQQLDLEQTNISDPGLSHLAVLPELQELNLNGTSISDAGVDTLLELPSLQRLSLENSRVTSQGASHLKHRRPELELKLVFPWIWGERWSYYSIANHDESKSSPIDRTSITAQLKDLTSLGHLHINESLLTPEVIRSLKDLPTLEHLSFQGTSISDEMLADLLGLSQVARLDLADTPITDRGLIHLKDIQGLRELNLQGTRVTGSGLVHLANLTKLQQLNLRQTGIDDNGLAHLAQLRQLRKLELSNTVITDGGLQHLLQLSNLRYLDLYGTNLTDAGVVRLKQLKSLRYCYLSHTAVTDSGIAELRELSDLEELGLDGTQLSDHGLEVLDSLRNLQRVRLGRTKVTEAGLSHVARLPNLIQLDLSYLPIRDDGLRPLQSLSKLRSLNLSGTAVTDKVLPLLAQFPELEEIQLQDTAITNRAVSQFLLQHPDIQIALGATRTSYSVWSLLITGLYAVAAAAICIYGLHRYWLVWQFLRAKDIRTSPDPAGQFSELPTLTVQLPMFNESRVAERIITTACALDYPPDRLQIQVLDDSTDDSTEIVRRSCERMASAGHRIDLLHRTEREGFKGGALAAGLKEATGEFIAVFDADFVPPPDILQRMVHYFTDPQIGMVQAEWSHLNRHQSLLTECQAMFLDGHFVVEQTTRSRNRRWFNFNGTAGVWRRTCIEAAGGWQHDTLTEDTDLSYRAQLLGWKFLYLPTVKCSAELPSTMTAFLGQQHRWTKGLIQNAKKLLPRIFVSSAPWRVKLEAWFHLTSPLMYLVMFLVTAIALPALFLATPLAHWSGLALGVGLSTLVMGTLAAVTFYVVSQRAQGLGVTQALFRIPVLMALGIGMSAVNARAVLEALLGWHSPFVRTPKFGGRADCDVDPSASRRGWRIPTGFMELVMAGILLACLGLSFLRPYTLIGAPFLLLFALGYAQVGALSLLDVGRSLERHRGRLWRGQRVRTAPTRIAFGSLAVLVVVGISLATVMITSPLRARSENGAAQPIVSLGVDLTSANWQIVKHGRSKDQSDSAIKRILVDRGSLVLNVQLDEQHDEGEIVLELDGAMQSLGESLGAGRPLEITLEYPSRFTGEFQVFVKDGQFRSEYGSMEFIESHDVRRAVTVSLNPALLEPAMGYQDSGFDPRTGIHRVGLKISAQSDRVRGAGYRPFRGTIRVAKVRIRDVDRAVLQPEILLPVKSATSALTLAPPEKFLAASGVDRPWPAGYAFSGPLTAEHVSELERTYAAISNAGCRFTRVYVGDYRTGLIYDGKGKIAGVEPAFLQYLDQLAEIANRHGITVMVSLTDNTMADGRGLDNVGFIREGEESQLFVTKVLAEFIKKMSARDVVWDIFNEPENVTIIPLREIQRYVDRVLVVGKQADADARFTVVSRSRSEIKFWQGRGLEMYSHNIFSQRALDEALGAPRILDAPIMVAEMAPEFATAKNLQALRAAGYSGVGIWGWDTDDKYEWDAKNLAQIVAPFQN